MDVEVVTKANKMMTHFFLFLEKANQSSKTKSTLCHGGKRQHQKRGEEPNKTKVEHEMAIRRRE